MTTIMTTNYLLYFIIRGEIYRVKYQDNMSFA